MLDRLTFPVSGILEASREVKDQEMQVIRQDPEGTYLRVVTAYEAAILPEFRFLYDEGSISDRLKAVCQDAQRLLKGDAKPFEKIIEALTAFLDDFRSDPLIQRLIVR